MKPGDKLEWHDARVERMELLAAGEARIVFSRFYFYEATNQGPATRMRTAELNLRDVDEVSLKGRYVYEGFVSYATVELPSGEKAEASVIELGGHIRRITIVFTNGAELDARCGGMILQFTD